MTTRPPERPLAVNRSFTPRAQRRAAENDEYAAIIRRVLRAYSRRVAAGDIEAVADMAAIADQIGTVIQDAINGLRATGYSWAEIALRLHITRQAAQQCWGTPSPCEPHSTA